MNRMRLVIDIELIDLRPDFRGATSMFDMFGYKNELNINDMIDNPGNYRVKRRFSKQVYLNSYSETNKGLYYVNDRGNLVE